jgi:hypothetical protein
MTDVIYNYPKTSCEIKKYNGCVNSCDGTYPFMLNKKPDFRLINTGVIGPDKLDPTFHTINVKNCPRSACKGVTYLNSDPRLYNSAGNSWLQLDVPPINATMKLDDIAHDKSLNCYGQGYNGYSDINAGQILYYTNRNTRDINFSNDSTVSCAPYVDPMDNSVPFVDVKVGGGCGSDGDYCLSWLRDSQYQRDDITSFNLRGIDRIKRMR